MRESFGGVQALQTCDSETYFETRSYVFHIEKLRLLVYLTQLRPNRFNVG